VLLLAHHHHPNNIFAELFQQKSANSFIPIVRIHLHQNEVENQRTIQNRIHSEIKETIFNGIMKMNDINFKP
jgi:hypothetical protein